MGYSKLEKNLIDLMKEEQAKLGYRKEAVRLYYPLSSLNHLFEAEDSVDAMQERLIHFPEDMTEKLGMLTVTHKGDRFCFRIPEEGSEYVHEHMGANEFIKELVEMLWQHGTTMKQIRALFDRHADGVICENIDNGEFDYLLRFPESVGDPYYYCFKNEGCHIIYHRFLPEDYADFDF